MMLYKSKNATGYKGVTKKGNKFQVQYAGEYLKLYGTVKEAAAAYAKVHNEKKAAVAAAIAAAKAEKLEKAKEKLEKAKAKKANLVLQSARPEIRVLVDDILDGSTPLHHLAVQI